MNKKDKILEINNLTKKYINKKSEDEVISNISFDVFEGEIISIVGTSGCGKSTLLNIISGLLDKTSGDIKYFVDKKSIGYMLQEPALFPWLTIEKNANLGSLIKKTKSNDYVDELLNKYDLYKFKNKYPNDLSGGMKQRVALIRTISTKPKLLLLDEPFAALDYQSRLLIGKDVYDLIKENNITTIIITHDISEAISMSDKVIVLSKRPCHIKNIYEINLENNINPIQNRKDKLFPYYYDLIGKDLDIFNE